MPMRLAGPAFAAGIMISVGSTMALAQAQLPPGGSSEPSPDRPVIASGRPVGEVQGIWRSRGYGYLLRIDADGLSLFHVAGSLCYADPRRADDPDGMFALYRPFSPDALAFSGTPGQTRYVFDRLPDLPAACTDS